MTSITSSDGSLGEHESTSSAGDSRRRRRSLDDDDDDDDDDDVSLQRATGADFSDMPSLSSFRADEMSAVTSTSYTSNSKGGDSKAGDCDASLPSLSSFRMEDLSTCSSYHSLQTNTNHLSDQSVEGWGSFTSGNVSAETDSEDGKRRSKLPDHAGAPIRPSRSSSGSSLNSSVVNGSPIQRDARISLGKAAIDHDGSIPSKTTARRRPSGQAMNSKEDHASPMIRPTRTASPVPDVHHTGANSNISAGAASATDNPRPPARNQSPDRYITEHASVERSKSLDLSFLQRSQKEKTGSATEESSSSLRGGDSLPRLPRRTSTGRDNGFPTETARFSDDASNVSDVSTKISDDEVTRISDDNASLDSDVESDISIDTDTEHITLGDDDDDDDSERSSVDLSNLRISGEHVPQIPLEALNCSSEKNEHDHSEPTDRREEASNPVSSASADCDGPIFTTENSPELSTLLAKIANAPSTNEEINEKRNTQTLPAQNENESKIIQADINMYHPTDDDGKVQGKTNEPIESSQKSATSYTDSERHDPTNEDRKGEGIANGPIETSQQASRASYGDAETYDPTNDDKKSKGGENKRGSLLRKVSSSFRNIGKSSSFRNSFRAIGKQASKLKMMASAKTQKEEGNNPSPR